jgi:hypothetical protein
MAPTACVETMPRGHPTGMNKRVIMGFVSDKNSHQAHVFVRETLKCVLPATGA